MKTKGKTKKTLPEIFSFGMTLVNILSLLRLIAMLNGFHQEKP